MGQEKRFNYAFQLGSRDEFIDAVMAGMPRPPAYYPTMKRVNKVGPTLLEELPAGKPLSAGEVAALQDAGALLIDARSPAEFAAAHIPGSVNVGLGTSFAIWAGWLAPYDREVVLILPRDDHYDEARTELRRIGIDTVAGFLQSGIEAWTESGRPTGSLQELSIDELAERLIAAKNELRVIDVRDEAEWVSGHVPDACNLPAGAIAQGAMADVDPDVPVAVMCGSGYRSAVAASLLKHRGIKNVMTVPGGMSAWTEAGLPTSR
jgi:hydroxyacylglutathione hydrolase